MSNPAAPLLDRLDTTVCVLTTALAGRPAGCIVTYVTPASLHAHRPRVVVLTSHENLTHELLDASGVLALHPVARGQEGWVGLFGFRSGRDADKFADVAWSPGETGAPLLADAMGWLEGRVLDSLDCGDHTARLVEPLAVELRDPAAVPLRAAEAYAAGLADPREPAVFPWRA